MSKYLFTLSYLLCFWFVAQASDESTLLNTLEAKTTELEKELHYLKQEMQQLRSQQISQQPDKPEAIISLAGTPVISLPFIGRRPGFDPNGELLYNANTNQDIRYMSQRSTLANSISLESPVITLNGLVEPIFSHGTSFSETSTGTGNLTMSAIALNTGAIINPWVEGVVSVTHASQPANKDFITTEDQNVQINQAYANIGNLNETPFYMSAGELYVPFGQQFTNMVSFPLSTVLNTVKTITTVAGKAPTEPNDFFISAYTFNSKTTVDNSLAAGLNIGYTFKDKQLSGDIGTSIISSIGDASGFQATAGTNGEFAGFNANTSTEAVGQVPGGDIYGLLRIGSYSVIGEYTIALSPFNASALSYNGEGAQPSALNAEIARGFSLFNKHASFALGYGCSSQALALQLPQQTFRAILNVSWWPSTLQALEFEHNINYSTNDYGAGIGSTANTNGTSTSSDVIEFLMGVAF